MHVYVRLDNCTTKPRFQSRNQSSKNEKTSTCNVPEDENNLVQMWLGGEIWTSDVIMHKAHSKILLSRPYDRGLW